MKFFKSENFFLQCKHAAKRVNMIFCKLAVNCTSEIKSFKLRHNKIIH